MKAASTRLETVPAQYETVTEEVLVRPAYTTWKKGTGPIQRIDQATGEIMCLVEVPAELADRAAEMRSALVEMVAESDESLMETFFEAGDLTEEQLIEGLRKGIVARTVYPVFFTSHACHRHSAVHGRTRRSTKRSSQEPAEPPETSFASSSLLRPVSSRAEAEVEAM